MRGSSGLGVSLIAVTAAIAGCDEPPPACAAGWLTPGDESMFPEHDDGEVSVEPLRAVPIQAVTGRASSAYGMIVGGVSSSDDLFWDAWVITLDGAPPRRLAPIGDALVSIDGSGALWTTIVSEDASGAPAYEVRVSPADGSPSVLLSPDLPPNFRAERAVTARDGARLLAGTETRDGTARASVFAVAANGAAARLACDPRVDSPLILDARVAPDALHLLVQYADGPPTTARVARR